MTDEQFATVTKRICERVASPGVRMLDVLTWEFVGLVIALANRELERIERASPQATQEKP